MQCRGTVWTFNTRKSIIQRSRKTFSFLNYVNINSSQSYSLSTFIVFVFLFLGWKYNSYKISIKFFVWFLFLMGFSLITSFWQQNLLVSWRGDVETKPGPKSTPITSLSICTGTWIAYLLTIMSNCLSEERILHFINSTLFIFQKAISVLVIRLMPKTWKYLDAI